MVSETKKATVADYVMLGLVGLSALALATSYGAYHPLALGLYSTLAVALFALPFMRSQLKGDLIGSAYYRYLLWLIAGAELAVCLWQPKVIYAKAAWWLPFCQMVFFILVTGFVVALPFLRKSAGRILKSTWAVIFLAVAAAYFAVPLASPNPWIDVFVFQNESAQALLKGLNPYQMDFTNIYGEGIFYYPTGRADSYPYPPLSFVYNILGLLTGDVRWGLITSHFFAGVFVFLTARKKGVEFSESVLLAFLLIGIPGGLFMVEQSWVDASVVFALSIAFYFSYASNELARALAFGAALALKQTMIILLPFLWVFKKFFLPTKKFQIAFILVPVLTALPFLLWDANALIYDLVVFHLRSPFRGDALTISSWLHSHGYLPLAGSFSMLGLALGVFWFCWKKSQRVPSQFWLGLAATYLVTLLASKHAFYNYYYGVHCLLVFALVSLRVETVEKV